MEKIGVKGLTLCGMFTALVTIGTMAITIPTPMTSGYVNLGDGFILTISFLFGGTYGLIAGGIGSALADILLGYAHWAPFTLVIKGLMGFTAALLFNREKPFINVFNIAAVVLAETIMVGGYFLSESLIYSNFATAAASVPANIVQAVAAIAVFAVLAGVLKNIRFGGRL